LVAGVFEARGADAWVVSGDDGLDEITVTTTSTIWRHVGGDLVIETVDPRDVGLELAETGALAGGDPEANAEVFRRILAGDEGPIRDAVLLNAGAGLAVHAAGEGPLVEQLAKGVARARDAIDSGAAAQVLEGWITASGEAPPPAAAS
jgi:anthranilate phosphoribosyltransferase